MRSFLTDKSLEQEARFGGWALAERRSFAEPGAEPNYAPDRGYRIEHLALTLAVDPVARTVRGEATVKLTALPGQDGWYALDLDELTVDGVEDGGGNPHPWRHADGKLLVAPAAEVRVRWHGSPRRGMWFVGPTPAEPERVPEAWTQCQDEDGHFLFPCFDHPSVKHPFRITVTAPVGYGVLSNGRLVSREGDTWTWDQAEPMPAYLLTVVVMKMDVVEDTAPCGPGVAVPLRYVVPAGTPDAVTRRAFGRTPKMMALLSKLYGAYPWPRYDQVVVHDFIFGGMENTAATTLTDLVLADDRSALDGDMDDLVVHELAHQWFGDLLTCQDWSQGWLNEGWATYTEHLWEREDKGIDDADWHLWEQLGLYLGEDGGRYRRPIVSYRFKAPIDMFDRHLYEKAALVIHTLRHQLGDGPFWAGVHLYLARHRYGTVHTRDFQRALEDATGRNLDRFFAQWILGAGHPALEVSVSHADGQLSIAVKQTQEGEGVEPVFHFPLVVAFGDNRVTLKVDARERAFVLPCADAPAFVRIDPDFQLLADIKVKGARSGWIAALRGEPNVVGRVRAARALAEDGAPEAVDALADAVRKDTFWGVRAEIADLLAARGGERCARVLIDAASDPHPKARRRIIAALGNVRQPLVVDALSALGADPSAQVEGEIARSLARLRAPAARAACERLLDQPSWGEVLRARAIEGLGHLRDATVLDTLLARTSAATSARARAAACAALARIGDEVESTRSVVVERLIELAEDPNFRVQVSAINALGTLRDPRSLGVLGRVHDSAPDGRCRRLAYEASANVREGRTSAEGLATLRREIEGVVEENRKLRDRLARLEDRK
jgi:aminopeptidase N